MDQLNGVVRENLINIRVVKSFVREDFETKKFTRSSEELRDMVIRASNIVVSIFPVMQLVMNLSILAILWLGGQKVMYGELKVGELISFVNYLAQVLMSLMMLSMIIMSYARASASSKRILEVLDTKPSLTNTQEGLQDKYRIEKGEVTFDNVGFRYTGGENDVLQHISFRANPGETIALVGATGSAKSSLVQLIPRLYDATSGEIRIDGIPVKNYNLDELHARIGMVLQKERTVYRYHYRQPEMGKAGRFDGGNRRSRPCRRSTRFHLLLHGRYNTLLGRGGINVSGGQKQRICIARALLRKPKILILDDSTSAVDTETELKIRNNLNAMLHDTTVFIITQRINTMQSADRVIVLEDGEINAIGTPDELIKNSTVYQEIYHSQQVLF